MQRKTIDLELKSINLKAAREFCRIHHSYAKPPVGALFAVGTEHENILRCVAIVGRPISSSLDDGKTAEVIRLISDGATFNAASFTLRNAAKAAFALGYCHVISYTDKRTEAAAFRSAGFNIGREHKVKAWHGREMLDEVGRRVIRWEVFHRTHSTAAFMNNQQRVSSFLLAQQTLITAAL
jgi:hypothetical protein